MNPSPAVASCACPSRDGRRCVEIRYGRRFEADSEDPCDCACHDIAVDDSLDGE